MVVAVTDVVVPFLSFLEQLSCCVSSGFTDFRTTFDNFTSLVSVRCQIFQPIRSNTERFHWDLLCIFEALFLVSLETLALRQFAVGQFFREDDLSCGQYDRPNEAVITSRWCRSWEDRPELKLRCRGCGFAMWWLESSPDKSCESGLAFLYALDKLSTFHSHKGGWEEWQLGILWFWLPPRCLSDSTHCVTQRLHSLLRVWCSPRHPWRKT